jgi:CRP-like cAMP-binding protein
LPSVRLLHELAHECHRICFQSLADLSTARRLFGTRHALSQGTRQDGLDTEAGIKPLEDEMQNDRETRFESAVSSNRKNQFINALSAAAQADFESMQIASSYPAASSLFTETEPNTGIYVVLEGEVKVSINSADGGKVTVHIAQPGDVLGLSSALCGGAYEMTAETLYQAQVAHISRESFLEFLAQHEEVSAAISHEVARGFTQVCEQLCPADASIVAPKRLARVVMVWGEQSDRMAETGSQIRLSMSGEEIGELVGAHNQIVTRSVMLFKNQQLEAKHGCTLATSNASVTEEFSQR